MTANSFKIILKDQDDNEIDLDYKLHDSLLAEKWAKTLNHLKRVPIDPIESKVKKVTDLKNIYSEFCKFSELEPVDIEPLDQNKLNQLHEIYERHHERLCKIKNHEVIYKFHHCIHYHEDVNKKKMGGRTYVSWGKREGPLTTRYDCYKFYENTIFKNNIYLPWAELGKTPQVYWRNKEPNNQCRFNELAVPHVTFRAKFFIALHDYIPPPLDPKFVQWFDQFKEEWFAHHGVDKWDNIHEHSAPLLATTDCPSDLRGFSLKELRI